MMKFNRSLVVLVVLTASTLFAVRYGENQSSCASCPYNKSPRTSEVYRPTPYRRNRVALDYEGNEMSKRLPTEHFTFDPEEEGLTRR